jgi:putative sigma-54 modulation protein
MMRLTVRNRNGAVPEKLKQHAQKKVSKLEKYFDRIQSVDLLNASERGLHIVEINLEGDGLFLRSEERSSDLYAAVDTAVDKMERQIKRFKERVRRGRQRPGPIKEVGAEKAAAALAALQSAQEDEERLPRIVRHKRFPVKPMSAEEAAAQMELVDHDFFLFLNEDSGAVSVLYRRRDGEYGLIESEDRLRF